MECKDPKYEKGLIIFSCPYCNGALDADESLLGMIWERHQGQIPCPVESCQKAITVPTKEQVVALMAGAAAPNTAAPVVDPTPTDTDKTETEVAVASPAPAPVPQPVAAEKAPAPAPAAVPVPEAIKVEETDVDATATPNEGEGGTTTLDIKHGFGQAKPVTLEQESKGGELTIRTFRHSEFQKDGKDTFDEAVTSFLREQGEENVISVNPVQYSNGDKQAVDFGVIVYYKTS